MAIKLTDKAIYTGLSYDDLAAPFVVASKAYDEQKKENQSAIEALNTLGSMLNPELDVEQYKAYSDYRAALNNAIDSFSHGMNINNRSELNRLRSQYLTQLQPLELLAQKRAKMQEEQRKAWLSDETLQFERDMTNTSLNDFINNPTLDWGRSFSANNAVKKVAAMAGMFQNKITDEQFLNSFYASVGEGVDKKSMATTLQHIQQYGFTPEDILDAVQNPGKTDGVAGILNKIIDDATADAKQVLGKNSNEYKRYRANAAYGISSGSGKETRQMIRIPNANDSNANDSNANDSNANSTNSIISPEDPKYPDAIINSTLDQYLPENLVVNDDGTYQGVVEIGPGTNYNPEVFKYNTTTGQLTRGSQLPAGVYKRGNYYQNGKDYLPVYTATTGDVYILK